MFYFWWSWFAPNPYGITEAVVSFMASIAFNMRDARKGKESDLFLDWVVIPISLLSIGLVLKQFI